MAMQPKVLKDHQALEILNEGEKRSNDHNNSNNSSKKYKNHHNGWSERELQQQKQQKNGIKDKNMTQFTL